MRDFYREAQPIDPEVSYCFECGNQFHECVCDDLLTYGEVRDHPSLYRQPGAANGR